LEVFSRVAGVELAQCGVVGRKLVRIDAIHAKGPSKAGVKPQPAAYLGYPGLVPGVEAAAAGKAAVAFDHLYRHAGGAPRAAKRQAESKQTPGPARRMAKAP
jgi:hypothetical protein